MISAVSAFIAVQNALSKTMCGDVCMQRKSVSVPLPDVAYLADHLLPPEMCLLDLPHESAFSFFWFSFSRLAFTLEMIF